MTSTAEKRLMDGLEALTLALDPELAQAKAEWLEAEASRKAANRSNGSHSGWQRGTPQCPSCRRILSGYGAWCPDCRTYDGRHSHTY